MHWSKAIFAILCLLAPIADAMAMADAALAYETIEPSRIRLGDSALIKVITWPLAPLYMLMALRRSAGWRN